MFFRARGGMGNTIYLLDFVRETMVREWRGGRECSPGQKYHVFSGFFSSPSAVGEGVFEDFPACGAAICKISRMSIAVDFSLSLERASQNCIGYPSEWQRMASGRKAARGHAEIPGNNYFRRARKLEIGIWKLIISKKKARI